MTDTTPITRPGRPAKTVASSRAEQVHIIMPVDVNASYTLFGGMLMQWIDVVAGVVSRRHCEGETRTAAIDHLEFLAPAYINDTVTISGRITCVGNTSMEVCVDTFVERMYTPNQRIHVNRAYLTMVAIGKDGKPVQVPDLIPETDDERADFLAGQQRRQARKHAKG